ncbi:MAG TPA: polyphosphate--nucleotide phosphotransferase [Actinobacteria bacterium]|nr:polyphosphate--nucleotide phosphotransferase [Actinomycetota bacterium]
MVLAKKTLDQLKISPGERVRLAEHDPAWLPDKVRKLPPDARKTLGKELLRASREGLAQAQELLYADDRWSLLVVFQAMDAAGKDSTIKHVMSGVNPQGCSVTSFKQPSAQDLDHNFLWRTWKAVPARGQIGIFNRSHYEEVLVVKVHPELLDAQRIPDVKVNKAFWQRRYDDINDFESHLARNGTKILKFFLNVSKDEQRQRFLDRIEDPAKHWKFSQADLVERELWNDYQQAYQDAIAATSTAAAPWYVIPADRKWAMRAVVADIITTTIQGMDLHYPTLSAADEKRLADAKVALTAQG